MFKTDSTTKVATYILIGAFFIVVCGVFLCNPAKGEKPIKQKPIAVPHSMTTHGNGIF